MSTSLSQLAGNNMMGSTNLEALNPNFPPQQMQHEPQAQQDSNVNINQMAEDIHQQLAMENQGGQHDVNSGYQDYQMDPSQVPEPMYDYGQMHQQMAPYGEEEPEMSLTDKAVSYSKLPALVVGLFVVMSSPQFNRLLTSFFPRFLTDSGRLTYSGIFAKAFVAGLLVFLVNFFLL